MTHQTVAQQYVAQKVREEMQPIYDAFGVNPSPQPTSDVDDLKELLPLAARAMGAVYVDQWENGALLVSFDGKAARLWNPLTPGDGAEMEDKLRISVIWLDNRVWSYTHTTPVQVELFADHPDAGTARRWASLRVAAAIGRSMK
jgi:hypothetical protein